MERKANYWIGIRPSNSKRWQMADYGAMLDRNDYEGSLFSLIEDTLSNGMILS